MKKLSILLILFLLLQQINISADLVKIVGDGYQKNILEFEAKIANKIEEKLKDTKTAAERKKVINYVHSDQKFDLKNAIFWGDCSWLANEILKEVNPKLHKKMLKLKESGDNNLRAYVYYHIFNEILRLKTTEKNMLGITTDDALSEPNNWIHNTTPNELKKELEKNLTDKEKINKAVKSYTKRYNFFKKMQTKEWQKNLADIKNDWTIVTHVDNWKPGDFLVAYYKVNKGEAEEGEIDSTGHSMMIIGYPKKVGTGVYEIEIMDSGQGPRIDDKIRKGSDDGIGIGKIRILVNPATEKPIGWQTKKSDSEWRDTGGRMIVGRME
ncbi:hypothetical protein L6269_01045 [Candidatus Dependentiae bacterium]|nr:hypothetical protein [Candidatus Dependentiae bacterium]